MKKKPLIIIISSAAAVLMAVASLVTFLPVSYHYDKGLIKKNEAYAVEVLKEEKYTTLSNGRDDFKILGFTDTHLDTYRRKSTVSLEMVIRNIVNEKPDLVVFDGDIITSSFNRRRANQFADVMTKLGVYWTAVLGNHEGDNNRSVSRQEMIEIYAKSPYCLVETSQKTTKNGSIVDGFGNHVINIVDSKNTITQSLYLIDGGAYMSDEDLKKYKDEIPDAHHNGYDYIKQSQIDWYSETVKDVESLAGSPVKSMLFTHIPLPEFEEAYNLIGEGKAEEGDSILFGDKREVICHPGHNSGMFSKIKELDSTKCVVSGHDHINNFVLSYQGVRLGYCQSSGYSSYNVVTKGLEKELLKGYSVFNINEHGDVGWKNVRNADIWPELQDKILKLY